MEQSISVIVATYNRKERLRLFLESLRADFSGKPAEVIVVDDGSSDGTREFLEEQQKSDSSLRVIYQKNSGQSRARNKGAQMARGDVVAFSDDDCVVLPGWINAIQKSMSDPLVLAVEGPVIGKEEGDPVHPLRRILHNMGPKAFLSSNLAVRKNVFIAEGGFDESMRMHEDTDLCLRILRKGKIAYNADMRIRHPQETVWWWREIIHAERYARRYVFSEYILYLKNPGQYHRVRYHPTFYKTFFHYSFKYAYYFCKMPGSVILRHPIAYWGRWMYYLVRQFFIAFWFTVVCLWMPKQKNPESE